MFALFSSSHLLPRRADPSRPHQDQASTSTTSNSVNGVDVLNDDDWDDWDLDRDVPMENEG